MRIAIVTGASSGIGREFICQIPGFYKELDEIWVIARRQERLKEIKEETETGKGPYVRIFAGDLRKDLVYKQIRNRLENQNPDVRMLVNAAGFGKIGEAMEIEKEEPSIQFQMIDVNCRALTKMTLLVLPYMRKGSRIINISSGASFCPQPGFAVYAATKAYVTSFSRGLAEEVKKRGIVVTAVCPGPVNTEFFEVSGTNSSKAKEAVMAETSVVVRQALLDSRKKKAVSVYGNVMKGAYLAGKLLPQDLIFYMMDKWIK
nr:SDR family NAD(P)-dependent oxidoreductase [uncultured Sellimonas sp.]